MDVTSGGLYEIFGNLVRARKRGGAIVFDVLAGNEFFSKGFDGANYRYYTNGSWNSGHKGYSLPASTGVILSLECVEPAKDLLMYAGCRYKSLEYLNMMKKDK